jgi:hypothetical protein
MAPQSLLEEPGRVDEPKGAQQYADVLSQVAAAGRPVIVRRSGEDLAAVVPLEQLELVREILARQGVERSAAQIDWSRAQTTLRPPQSWFDDEADNPFEPEEEPASSPDEAATVTTKHLTALPWDDLHQLLRKKVENGQFPNEEAVVEEALRLFLNRGAEEERPQTKDSAEPETERLPGPFIQDPTVLAPGDLARTGQEVLCLDRHDVTRRADLIPGE